MTPNWLLRNSYRYRLHPNVRPLRYASPILNSLAMLFTITSQSGRKHPHVDPRDFQEDVRKIRAMTRERKDAG